MTNAANPLVWLVILAWVVAVLVLMLCAAATLAGRGIWETGVWVRGWWRSHGRWYYIGQHRAGNHL